MVSRRRRVPDLGIVLHDFCPRPRFDDQQSHQRTIHGDSVLCQFWENKFSAIALSGNDALWSSSNSTSYILVSMIELLWAPVPTGKQPLFVVQSLHNTTQLHFSSILPCWQGQFHIEVSVVVSVGSEFTTSLDFGWHSDCWWLGLIRGGGRPSHPGGLSRSPHSHHELWCLDRRFFLSRALYSRSKHCPNMLLSPPNSHLSLQFVRVFDYE